jgi:hypothetical protein
VLVCRIVGVPDFLEKRISLRADSAVPGRAVHVWLVLLPLGAQLNPWARRRTLALLSSGPVICIPNRQAQVVKPQGTRAGGSLPQGFLDRIYVHVPRALVGDFLGSLQRLLERATSFRSLSLLPQSPRLDLQQPCSSIRPGRA